MRDPTRRDFLASSAALAAAAWCPRSWLRPPAGDDRILVMLQLTGGNDALSTLVPYADDAYGRARRATRLAANDLLKLDERIGLHPALRATRALLDRGCFAAVQNVGYPQPNFSHFTSLDIWHSADLQPKRCETGWLGRWCDAAFPAAELPERAIAIGAGARPLALVGARHAGVGIGRPEGFRFERGREDRRLAEAYRTLQQPRQAAASDELAQVARAASAASACSDRILAAIEGYKPAAEYPGTPLGASFRATAALIERRLGTRVFWLAHGGYDTHAGQKQRHDRLMAELDAAIGAFQADLAQHRADARVLTVAFSEFGRRIQENGSGGTDHGAAGTMLLYGPAVSPGLHGGMPVLAEGQRGGNSLAHQVDFRQVYAELLERWFSTPAKEVVGEFAPVGCLRE